MAEVNFGEEQTSADSSRFIHSLGGYSISTVLLVPEVEQLFLL